MATKRGGHITLLAGTTQLSITTPGYFCASRSSSGVCITVSGLTPVKYQVSYFSFTVASQSSEEQKSIMFTVLPSCNISRSSGPHCMPGCDCNPLTLYVSSCPASRCTSDDKYPSYFRKAGTPITSFSHSVVISPNSFTASTYCDPVANGEACIYYLTVLSKQSTEAVTFSINAEAPGDVGVISSCCPRWSQRREDHHDTPFIHPRLQIL